MSEEEAEARERLREADAEAQETLEEAERLAEGDADGSDEKDTSRDSP